MLALTLPYCHYPLMSSVKRGMLKWIPGLITCAEFENFVVDYLDNTLPEAQRKVFTRHLTICPECRDYIEHYTQTIQLASKAEEYTRFGNAGDPPKDLLTAILEAQKAAKQD